MNRWSALLLGGLLGAAAALLWAPQAGQETRRKLRSNVDELQGRTQDQIRQGRMRITELVRSSQERADELTTRMKGQTSDAIERARREADEAARRAQEQIAETSQNMENRLGPEPGMGQ
ncbi:MAG TPA: YtxH domain-containing protein [Stenomitos sp.]